MRALSEEEVRNLLAKQPESEAARDWVRPESTVYACSFCGCCETPNKCVWSITCPECGAAPSEPCTATGNKIVPIHEVRWMQVSFMYGTYYK